MLFKEMRLKKRPDILVMSDKDQPNGQRLMAFCIYMGACPIRCKPLKLALDVRTASKKWPVDDP